MWISRFFLGLVRGFLRVNFLSTLYDLKSNISVLCVSTKLFSVVGRVYRFRDERKFLWQKTWTKLKLEGFMKFNDNFTCWFSLWHHRPSLPPPFNKTCSGKKLHNGNKNITNFLWSPYLFFPFTRMNESEKFFSPQLASFMISTRKGTSSFIRVDFFLSSLLCCWGR